METILIELTPVVSIAMEVIAGKYGNGEERIRKLKSEGYDVEKVQRCVNDIIAIMERYK
jgi:hypothetical protein